MSDHEVEQAVKAELSRQGLDEQILWEESQILFVGYYVAQIVLRDGAVLDTVRSALANVRLQLALSHIDLDPQVRAKWNLKYVGSVEPLYANDGGLRAASVVPVYLTSGSAEKTAYVVVTWAADRAIRQLDPTVRLEAVATQVVKDRLDQGGESAWDPLADPAIEINAAAAPYVSHLLQKAA